MSRINSTNLLCALVLLLHGCASLFVNDFSLSSIETKTLQIRPFGSLIEKFVKRAVPVNLLIREGPFKVRVTRNHDLLLAPNFGIEGTLYSPINIDSSPLVILSHGNHFSSENHEFQAHHMASWGFHTYLLDLPNKGQWLKNGQKIYHLVRLITAAPQLIAGNFNGKVILAGHSFGGSAITYAASLGADILGLLLLDPAIVSKSLIPLLQKEHRPKILLGADIQRFRARRRELFFELFPDPMIELSVSGSTHNDAQWPTNTQKWLGFDFESTRILQSRFMHLIMISLISIYADDQSRYRLNFALDIFKLAERNGFIKSLRHK